MKTRDFLRQYAWVYLYVAALFLFAAALLRHTVETVGSMEPFGIRPVIIIDAGHGAPDGGSTGVSGTREDGINLAVAKRLQSLLTLLGYDTMMTRTDGNCIASEGETIRQKKQSDLKNRAALVNSFPAAVLISIHQNHFPDGRYSGPQVLHTRGAEELARGAQLALTQSLASGSKRQPKLATGIYLMEQINHPGILVECGFLSNPEEERKLNTPVYQKKIASVLAAVLANYVHPSA